MVLLVTRQWFLIVQWFFFIFYYQGARSEDEYKKVMAKKKQGKRKTERSERTMNWFSGWKWDFYLLPNWIKGFGGYLLDLERFATFTDSPLSIAIHRFNEDSFLVIQSSSDFPLPWVAVGLSLKCVLWCTDSDLKDSSLDDEWKSEICIFSFPRAFKIDRWDL